MLERLEGRVNEILVAPGRVLWRVVPLSDTDLGSLRRVMVEKTAVLFGADMAVGAEFVETISHTPTGKLLRVLPVSEAVTGNPGKGEGI